MSRSTVLLRYDGPALAGHKMDVRDLAPALMAFGNLCREANRVINGSRASVRVLVNADINANCVTVSLDVEGNTVLLSPEVAKLASDAKVVEAAKGVIRWSGGSYRHIGYRHSCRHDAARQDSCRRYMKSQNEDY